jgi:NTE family protein
MMRVGVATCVVAAVSMLLACAQYPKAPVVAELGADDAYRLEKLDLNRGNSDRTFVFLALSGGGTRAAAFSYGAMHKLSQAPLAGGEFVLLDEVDVISSVSGGSFASAYYVAHGREKFLVDFPEDVLRRKLQTGLIFRLLAPWNWWKLGSWWYGRSDLAAEYYDPIFAKQRYADLPRTRPLLLLNATDISTGSRFAFEQDYFDRLCADLNGVSVARGVTASSAFPIAFTPLSVRNYPSDACGYSTPMWIENAYLDLELNGALFERARTAKSYEDPNRKVIHLSDGGLADNIGLRGPLEGVLYNGSPLSILRRMNVGEIDRVVFIAVDARPRGEFSDDESGHPPGILTVLNAAASKPMENYSTDTLEIAREFIARWNSEQLDAEGLGPQVAFYSIHVRFELEQNPEIRKRLQSIPTKLQLPSDQVDLLVLEGGALLQGAIQYRCLMEKIGQPGSVPEISEDDRELCPER